MNPNALEVKARQYGWSVIIRRDVTTRRIILNRDDWEMAVSFQGNVPVAATLRKAGSGEPRKLPLREIGRWVRGDRRQLARFAIGDHVEHSRRSGTVTDITLGWNSANGPASRVKLTIRFDGGEKGTLYTDQVRGPHALRR
ncbi:MAG: hypothetical protein HOY71_28205 [Nonomuraea sp.]|nr:hypothetical protein [Nonomuraea sp.]